LKRRKIFSKFNEWEQDLSWRSRTLKTTEGMSDILTAKIRNDNLQGRDYLG
jgi:hypothetical protein